MKSTNHAPGAPISFVRSARSSTTGTVRSAFANPPGAGRLLSDAVELQRDRLVRVPRLVAADPKLHDHEVGTLEGLALVAGEPQRAAPPGSPHHALGERAHDGEPFGIDVQQGQLVDGKAVATRHEPLDELGRVRAASTHDSHLHTHDFCIVHSGREIVRKLS